MEPGDRVVLRVRCVQAAGGEEEATHGGKSIQFLTDE